MFAYRALFSILISGFIFMAGTGNAATIVASSCAQSDVQSALNSSSSGDTVMVPSGKAAWTSGVTIPKGVKLIGAGIGNTIISSSSYITTILYSNSLLEGFEFTNGNATPNPTSGEQGWVIKDNYFGNTGGKQDIAIDNTNATKPSTGVYHGNTIIGCSFNVAGKSNGQYAWAQDDNWGGTDEVVYIENNIIDLDDFGTANQVLDSARGARVVFRFNEIHNGWIQTHGARDSSSLARRSSRLMEWYGNSFIQPETYQWTSTVESKGGAAMVFDNTCTGHSSRCQYMVTSERLMSGSIHGVCSADNDYDTQLHPLTGSVGCRDVVGMGKDVTQSPYPPNNEDSEQADQTYSPSYFWANKYGGKSSSLILHLVIDGLINENLDFFQGDGTADQGVTSGPLSSAPSCNAGTLYHGYWATDQGNWNQSESDDIGYGAGSGSLYQCQYTNGSYSWGKYYTPAYYPHPLIKSRPAAPKNPYVK